MSDHWPGQEPSSVESEGSSNPSQGVMISPLGWRLTTISREFSGKPDQRPSLNQTLMSVAALWADRSTCTRGSVGCVIADYRGHILSTGFNGAPAGMPHCTDVGCLLEDGHCVRAVHAEINAIGNAARWGVRLDRAGVFITVRPCLRCTYLLLAAGVDYIYYWFDAGSEDETADAVVEACQQRGVPLIKLDGVEGDAYSLLDYRQQPKAVR